MYAGSVLPWNSYRSYENLRQFHLGERNGVREFDAALRGVKTGVLRRDGYRMLMRIAGESKDSTNRGAMWKALLDELLDAARKPFPADDYRHIPPDRLTETIVAALVLARNAGHGDIAGGMLEKFDTAIDDWPSLGVYYSYLRGDLDVATRAAIMRRSLTPDTEEPLLAFMAGTAYARAGDHASAVVFLERTLSLAPCEFSKAFTDLAAIYHDVYGDREKALHTLRRYRESCEFRPDDREIQDMIDRYESGT